MPKLLAISWDRAHLPSSIRSRPSFTHHTHTGTVRWVVYGAAARHVKQSAMEFLSYLQSLIHRRNSNDANIQIIAIVVRQDVRRVPIGVSHFAP